MAVALVEMMLCKITLPLHSHLSFHHDTDQIYNGDKKGTGSYQGKLWLNFF